MSWTHRLGRNYALLDIVRFFAISLVFQHLLAILSSNTLSFSTLSWQTILFQESWIGEGIVTLLLSHWTKQLSITRSKSFHKQYYSNIKYNQFIDAQLYMTLLQGTSSSPTTTTTITYMKQAHYRQFKKQIQTSRLHWYTTFYILMGIIFILSPSLPWMKLLVLSPSTFSFSSLQHVFSNNNDNDWKQTILTSAQALSESTKQFASFVKEQSHLFCQQIIHNNNNAAAAGSNTSSRDLMILKITSWIVISIVTIVIPWTVQHQKPKQQQQQQSAWWSSIVLETCHNISGG